jgi:hypothetical protein
MSWFRNENCTAINNITPLALTKLVKFGKKILAQRDVIGEISLNMMIKDKAIHFISDSNHNARLFYKLEDKDQRLFQIDGQPVCFTFFDQEDFLKNLDNYKHICEANKLLLFIRIYESRLLISHNNNLVLFSTQIDRELKPKSVPELLNENFLVRLSPRDVKYLAGTKSDSDIKFNEKTLVVEFKSISGSYVVDSQDSVNDSKLAQFFDKAREVYSDEEDVQKMGNILLSAKLLTYFKDSMGKPKKKKNYEDDLGYDVNCRFLNFDIDMSKQYDHSILYIFKNKKDVRRNFTESSCYRLVKRFCLMNLEPKIFDIGQNVVAKTNRYLISLEKEKRESNLIESLEKRESEVERHSMRVSNNISLQQNIEALSNHNITLNVQQKLDSTSNKVNETLQLNNSVIANRTLGGIGSIGMLQSAIPKEAHDKSNFMNNSLADQFNILLSPKKDSEQKVLPPLFVGLNAPKVNVLANNISKVNINKENEPQLNKTGLSILLGHNKVSEGPMI